MVRVCVCACVCVCVCQRPFERHFQEWRHSYGMKCLGIPNTKPFQGITLIEDAYTLWAKLKAEQVRWWVPGG